MSVNKLILRLFHIFVGHDYKVVGFHNFYGGKHSILSCVCGKEKYSRETFTEYKNEELL